MINYKQSAIDNEILDNKKIMFEEAKVVFKDVFKTLSNSGLSFEMDINYNLSINILEYIKENASEVCLFFYDVLGMYKNNNTHIVKHAIAKDFNFYNVSSKNFFNKYENLCNMFNNNLCLIKLNYYLIFIAYIMRITDASVLLIDKIIDNLKAIQDFDIDNVSLNINFDNKDVNKKLYYQPYGTIRDEIASRVFYREENVFTDVKPFERYNSDNNCADLTFRYPSFIIKTIKKEGFSLLNGGNFCLKTANMMIYDIKSVSQLPSKSDLDNTLCELESYKQLMYMEKLNLLKMKMLKLDKKISDMKLNINDILTLFNDLDIDICLDITDDIFTDNEVMVMKNVKKKVKDIN